MKKFIAAAMMLMASESFAAGKNFYMMEVDGDTIEALAGMPTETLCATAATAFAMCDGPVYNLANMVITLRDVSNTRACQLGYDVGYESSEIVFASMTKEELEPIQNCNYIIEGVE